MKRIFVIVLFCVFATTAWAQSNNPLSLYEGERIVGIKFDYKGLPSNASDALNIKGQVQQVFRIYPGTGYSSFMSSYYISQMNLLPQVALAELHTRQSSESGVDLFIHVTIDTAKIAATTRQSIFSNIRTFPTIYNSGRTFLTLKFASSEMMYSNNNAWFGQPVAMTAGNPLATSPVGAGYTGWLEGFASAGLYGLVKIIPSINLNIYGGANYLASFSLGPELFTSKSRIYGDLEEAYFGLIGGGRTAAGHTYRYNILYGRKQFVLGDGFLIINTSMNGDNRAALQLNPRWAAKNLFQAGFVWDRLFVEIFRLQPNELPILRSETVINGVNLELGNKERMVIGASFLQVPKSDFRYYLPSGEIYSRRGLQVYNLRVFKNTPLGGSGLFFKAEGAYERNPHFAMSAWAGYGEVGWSFSKSKTAPALSYRFAYFSGDNASSSSYNRFDALYTGGNGEQWVQGSNMYKIVQNSNEMSHRVQVVFNPLRKMQIVGQLWLFYAPSLTNLGGNPALSQLKSKFYGSEINLTVKYFHSRNWYFHLNTAYTIPGGAIRDNLPGTVKDWFCLSVFARYSF